MFALFDGGEEVGAFGFPEFLEFGVEADVGPGDTGGEVGDEGFDLFLFELEGDLAAVGVVDDGGVGFVGGDAVGFVLDFLFVGPGDVTDVDEVGGVGSGANEPGGGGDDFADMVGAGLDFGVDGDGHFIDGTDFGELFGDGVGEGVAVSADDFGEVPEGEEGEDRGGGDDHVHPLLEGEAVEVEVSKGAFDFAGHGGDDHVLCLVRDTDDAAGDLSGWIFVGSSEHEDSVRGEVEEVIVILDVVVGDFIALGIDFVDVDGECDVVFLEGRGVGDFGDVGGGDGEGAEEAVVEVIEAAERDDDGDGEGDQIGEEEVSGASADLLCDVACEHLGLAEKGAIGQGRGIWGGVSLPEVVRGSIGFACGSGRQHNSPGLFEGDIDAFEYCDGCGGELSGRVWVDGAWDGCAGVDTGCGDVAGCGERGNAEEYGLCDWDDVVLGE